jgi:RHS repeat-associated protein
MQAEGSSRCIRGLNVDEPLATLRSSSTSYYQVDGLGSVTSLSNSTGSLVQTYGYDTFGKQTSSSGSVVNSLQYAAREFDPETSLYYDRARHFDPQAGRFVSEDPIKFGGGANFYEYVGNNPSLYVDPLGLWKNTGIPIDPLKNFYPTIVCNGSGGIRVWIPDWYNYPPSARSASETVRSNMRRAMRETL